MTSLTSDDLDLRAASTPAKLFEIISPGGSITLDEGSTAGTDPRGRVFYAQLMKWL